MSKHHHQSKEEQIYNKAHNGTPFHHEKVPYPRSASMTPKDNKMKEDKVAEVVPCRSSAIQGFYGYKDSEKRTDNSGHKRREDENMADKDSPLKPGVKFLKPLIIEVIIIGIALIIGIAVFVFVSSVKKM